MDGRKVVNFLQEGHRMQKPDHVDNKLLVEKLSVYFEGNSEAVSYTHLTLPTKLEV